MKRRAAEWKADTITYNHPADDRVYIVQNHFAGTKHLSEVLESMIELSLNQKAVNQDNIPKKGKNQLLIAAKYWTSGQHDGILYATDRFRIIVAKAI
ncbi:MAG: hypothetical protein ACOX45_07015 [Acutalibacteraceae bacterium]